MGDVIGDINGRRGQIVELTDRNGLKQVESTVPLANMFQVSQKHLLRSITLQCKSMPFIIPR